MARVDLPEEFRTGIDNNDDIVDVVCGERRIEGTSPEDMSKAHKVRGYLLQMTVSSDELDAKRAHLDLANKGTSGTSGIH